MQASFQIAGLVSKIGFFISFRICLWSVHITFSVHYFVELPVNHRSAGYSYLEQVGISQHQIGGHETSEAPAVYSYFVSIYVRQ